MESRSISVAEKLFEGFCELAAQPTINKKIKKTRKNPPIGLVNLNQQEAN